MIYKYKQQYNINYNAIWLKIIKSVIFRIIFEITVIYNLYIKQINVVIACLYDFLDKKVYVKQFYNFTYNNILICKLIKALYDLK